MTWKAYFGANLEKWAIIIGKTGLAMLVLYEVDWEMLLSFHPRQSDRHPCIKITKIRTCEFLVPRLEDTERE